MNDVNGTRRSPWIAAVLSLLCTGLGHIYCGRIARGVVLFVIPLLVAPAVVAVMLLPASGVALALLIAAVLAMPVVYLFAVVDSVRIARRVGAEFVPRDYNRPLVYALLLAVGFLYPAGSAALLRAEVVQAFMVPTASMAPAVAPGDRVLVDKVGAALSEPDRFAVVVFRSPENREQAWIKRIVGLPGDRLAVVDGEIVVNGEGTAKWEVPPGAIFVVGDNRPNSKDSRHFGCVPQGDVLGRVRYIFWPPGRFGKVD